MNNFKILLYLLLSYIVLSCDTNKNIIELSQKSVELPIIARLANDAKTRIITLQIPNKIEIKNNSNKEQTFLRLYYNYNETIPKERKGGFGIDLYEYNNTILNRVKNKKTKIGRLDKLSYIYYISHFIDSIQSHKLSSYIKKINFNQNNTLEIGTVADFKKKHKELFEKLTKNDSISIQFLEDKKLGETITVPVKY